MRKFVNDETIQNAYMQVLDILENVGVHFECEDVRELLKKRGARVEDDKVFFPCHLIEETLESTPKQDYSIHTEKRVVAATPFSNAPFILDDNTGVVRRCNIEDAVKMYQINETSSLYECSNPGCADPIGNDAQDQFVSQIAMVLKYSDKYPSIGLRATSSNSRNGDVYDSARQAFRLVRKFYDVWDKPVMTQGICPNPPLAYDQECLDNLRATIDEQQEISLSPCSLTFMTGPESIMGIVIHDFAMCLAGLAYIQIKSPGHPTSLSEFSTMSDIQTLQPAYGSAECVFIQVLFYELSKYLSIPCMICGSFGDGTAVDYQSGMEALLTTNLPFNLTEVDEVWCFPGIMAGFSCGSFHKAILDEEMMRYTNRMLSGVKMKIDPKLPSLITAGQEAGSFLSIGSLDTYRRDHYLTKIFNKCGIAQTDNAEKNNLSYKVQQVLENRIAAYQLPERNAAQMKLLQPYLPSQCRYCD
jgi:trimethylamine--corrinoid protein Co-methyltransferase